MKIFTDLQNIVSAVSTIIVSTTTKSNTIIDNVMDVGVAATGEWKADAEYDAMEAKAARATKYLEYQAQIAKSEKAEKKASTK